MEPNWHENSAQINAYADNLEREKNTHHGEASAASERAQRGKRAERPGARGMLCDPKTFQEICLGKRSEQEAIKTINGASRSMSNQVYFGGLFFIFLIPRRL